MNNGASKKFLKTEKMVALKLFEIGVMFFNKI